MYPTWDLVFCLAIWGVAVASVAIYLIRTSLRGRARHDRADSDGGSDVMGKTVVEYAYWLFEPLAAFAHRLGISPNAVTAFSLVPGFAAGVAAAGGYFGLAVVLATLAAFCDAVDGLIARKRRTASDAGEAFDAAVDRYMEFFFQAGLCLHFRAHPGPLLLCLGAMLAAFMVSYTTAKAESFRIEAPRGAMRRAERSVYMLVGAGLVPLWVLIARSDAPIWWREAPLMLALVLLAVIGNLSAFQRTRVMMQRLRARDAAS